MARGKVTVLVGIGASAGGLESMQSLLSCLPDSLDSTSIIIAQHLSPDYKSMLVELLGRKTKVPVSHVDDGAPIEPNHIYISPPSDDISISGGKFYLSKPAVAGAHPSVDVLFTSIAKEFGSQSVGVVLSGTGKDGSKGLEAINRAGGISIVQTPATAKYEGMPQAAINTGIAKFVLSPEEIGRKFKEITTKHVTAKQDKDNEEIPESAEAFVQILQLLEHRIGIDFSGYKDSTLSRRLHKRITDNHFKNEEQYLNHVKAHPEELDRLFEALLIGVTAFFRDSLSFECIASIIDDLVKEKKENDLVRIWVPGCATGEEAYTYAILANEALIKNGKRLSLQIFATDIDLKALHKARLGIYESQAVKKVPKELLEKYFKRQGNNYEVNKEIRRMVLFSRHDIIANPPFLRIDLLSCRNLLIYFNMDLQKKVMPLFFYSLNPSGYLILGKSENIGKYDNLFSTIDATQKVFRRKMTDYRMIKFPQLKAANRSKPSESVKYASSSTSMTIGDMVKETLYNNFDHAFVVVDDSFDIVEINGNITKYLQFRQGSANLSLPKLIISDLQIEMRALLNSSSTSSQPVYGKLRKIGKGKDAQLARITVKPIQYTKPNNRYFLVIFETFEYNDKLVKISNDGNQAEDSPRVLELENELDATKEHMNSLLEELETSNEELQALNEELQASNEELQASNEELETSNEELQATNEELENAYTELREANSQIEAQKKEIEESAENLETLLNNTLVGFVLIDKEFKILAVNKIARQLYKQLIGVQLKVGSSFIKLVPDSQISLFHSNFKKALSGEQVIIEESYKGIKGETKYFDVNYTPVAKNSSDDDSEARYVSVSFVDITGRKEAEKELIKSNKELNDERIYMQTLTENIPSLIWTTDSKGIFSYCNKYFLSYAGLSLREIQSAGWESIVHPDDLKHSIDEWKDSIKNSKHFNVEHRLRGSDGEYRWFLTVCDVVRGDDKEARLWVGSSTDIDSLKHQREMQQNVDRLKMQHDELIRINHVKDEFIGMASHQLRTPATAVKQYLNLLLKDFAGPLTEEQKKYLKIANDSNERQLLVISDLLKTAQLDAEDYRLHKDLFNVNDMVQLIAKELEPMMVLKGQKIVIHSDEPIVAKFDYDELKLALTNLLENAIKYSYDNTVITISLAKQNNHVVITVKDKGVGIKEVDQKRIFDKFTRVDNDLSDTVRGTGLGLYWVKRIADLHNGQISVDSKINEGSTFRLELPL